MRQDIEKRSYPILANQLTLRRRVVVDLIPPQSDWVVGLVAAGALAAALSTAAGLLLVISSSVAQDLLKKCIHPSISEKNELRAPRVAAGLAVLVAGHELSA